MSERKVVLDLFCGLGGFSAAFEDAQDWEVVTVDIEPEFSPDLCADVLDLRPSDLLQELGEYDTLVVLASPPCTDFPPMAWSHGKRFEVDGTPLTDSARESVALVHHTLGLIRALAPDYWLLENPRGALRWVIGRPQATIHYCAYGHYTKKPTDLWGDHPPGLSYRKCNHRTHTDEDGMTDMERGPSSAEERAKVPRGLSEAVLDATDDALQGEALEQFSVNDF